jgi:hypothetical protein
VIEVNGAAASPEKIMQEICQSLVSLALIDASVLDREAPASEAGVAR